MKTITITKLKDFLKAVAVKRRESVLIWGPPGVGKTEGVVQLAKELGAVLCDIRLSQYDSVDMRGIPSLEAVEVQHTPKGKVHRYNLTTWNIPATVPFVGNPNFPKDKPIVLFLDEVGSARESTMPVAMQLINERAVGEHKLMDNVIVIAATNRVSDRGTSILLPTTVLSRFTHTEVKPCRDTWCDWWLDQGGTPIAVAFYHYKEDAFFTFDPKNRELIAFATPRTNEKAWRYFMDDEMDQDLKEAAMFGAIGDGPAREALEFAKVWQTVLKPSEIAKDPLGVTIPDALDQLYATVINVAGHMTRQNVKPFAAFLKRLRTKNPSLEAVAWTLASRRTQGTPEDVTTADEYINYAAGLAKVYT